MKKGGWEIGNENATTIVNKDGEEEAERLSGSTSAQSGATSAQSGTLL